MKRPQRIYTVKDGNAIPYAPYMEIEAEKNLFRQVLAWRGIQPYGMKRCDRCGVEEKSRKNFVIHHRHYETLDRENPEDVCLLCKPCHEDLHRRHKEQRLTLDDIPFIDPRWEKAIRRRVELGE
jgi:hypothetical protein